MLQWKLAVARRYAVLKFEVLSLAADYELALNTLVAAVDPLNVCKKDLLSLDSKL